MIPARACLLPALDMSQKISRPADEALLNAVRDILLKNNETLAVAESVTAGILQTAFASATDASKYFQGGLTAYNLGQKSRHLRINPIHAESCNSVSEAVAKEMALNVCLLFSSDWGIGVTGYAAIDPEIDMEKPFLFYAIACRGRVIFAGRLENDSTDPAEVLSYYAREIIKSFEQILKSDLKA